MERIVNDIVEILKKLANKIVFDEYLEDKKEILKAEKR